MKEHLKEWNLKLNIFIREIEGIRKEQLLIKNDTFVALIIVINLTLMD